MPLENEHIPTTPEIVNWMSQIEQSLNEICNISTEGKLNSDQKLRVSNLCRKVTNGVSSMAVLYQALKKVAYVNQAVTQALKEKQDLSNQLQALQEKIQSTANSTNTPSFADMVKNSSKNLIQPKNLSSVAIYPTDKMKSSEETKNLVQKIINPEKMKLHVRAVRKVKNGGVIISTDSKDDITKLKEQVQNTSADLTINEPQKRKPRIVVVGVPSALQDQEVLNCIYEQNLADNLQDVSLEKFLTSIKLSHKSGKKNAETCNYVIEVPAHIRKFLISQNRVFVNWSSCPVRDFTIVTKCWSCHQYGHAAKSCKQPVKSFALFQTDETEVNRIIAGLKDACYSITPLRGATPSEGRRSPRAPPPPARTLPPTTINCLTSEVVEITHLTSETSNIKISTYEVHQMESEQKRC
ncbi:uncharacterized protein LOC134676842 [Cydia fagiglandana]|uniref:uncharacterized protein LOC134676842 n=1 Tax=Cydia fagiglandana TaxID=1458189 RepID=UPI002FEE53AC